MPLYEYECEACGARFEQIRKFSDPPTVVCPTCGEPRVRKLVSSPAIQFKGSGWYINDYAKKGKAGTDSSDSSSKDAKDSKDSKDAKDSKSPAPDSSGTSSSSGSTGSTNSSGAVPATTSSKDS